MASVQEIKQEVLADTRRYRKIKPNLQAKEVIIGQGLRQRRHIVCYNPRKAERERQHREQVVKDLKRLVNQHKDQLATADDNQLCLHIEAIQQAAQYDGNWVIQSNDDAITPEDAAFGYRALMVIECCLRSFNSIVQNPRYEGRIPYGKAKKTHREGKPARVKQEEYLTIDAPQLRIVDKKLVKAARKRQKTVGKTYIRNTNPNLWGRPGSGRESKYLLTDMGRCSCCGSNITLLGGYSGRPGKRKKLFGYGCSYHQNRGSTVCSNDHKAEMKETDDRVLTAIEQQIFVPGALKYTIDSAVELVMAHQQEDPKRPQQIERELKKLRKELDRFMSLIANGSAPTSVLEQISEREQRIQALETELAELQVQPFTHLDHKRLRKAASDRLGRFKTLLVSDVPLARQALRKLLAEPMRFEPVVDPDGRKTYKITGKTTVGALLDPNYIAMASPRGGHLIPQLRATSKRLYI